MLNKKIENAIKEHQQVVTKKYNELAACFNIEFEEGSYGVSIDSDKLAFYTNFEDETDRYTFKLTPLYKNISFMCHKRRKKSNYNIGSGKAFENPMDAILEIKESIRKIKKANEFLAYATQELAVKRRKFVEPLSDSELDFFMSKYDLISEIEYDKLKFDENKIVNFL
ncbi:hypothetical protein [Rossellomorea sp. FM04394]|uniref:hypothetical protein n=1 Tax=Rossellomorea sp. FM04394 TaxID=3243076 RepID=UPI0035A6EB89